MCQPQHQPGLTDFGSAGKQIQPLAQQPFDQLRAVRELYVHQFVSGDGVEAAYLDPQHPAHMLEGIGCFSEAVAFHNIVHHISFAAAVGAVPERIPHHLCVLPAMRADGEGGFVVGNLGGFQIIDEPELDLRSQNFSRLHGRSLPYAALCSSIHASSLSLGTTMRLPIWMVGKPLECISVYAPAREIPRTCATSSAQRVMGS